MSKREIEEKIEQPYIFVEIVVKERKWNPKYDQDKICRCGHTYDRHFDSYEDMYPVGCKYCECHVFMVKK